MSEVFARHGAPKYLVSDRGVQFVTGFGSPADYCLPPTVEPDRKSQSHY